MIFCCVTPCYNAEKHIEQTLRSVLSQSALQDRSNQLRYIIKDGGSTDTTMDKIRAVSLEYSNSPNISIEIISQADTGMYDALAMSFEKLSQGDVYSYINAGDYYSLFAFEIVAQIFMIHDVHFLTGLRCVYNEKNHLLSCQLPFKYNKALLLAGYYGTLLPHVQQESTFWSSKLHGTMDFECLKNTRLAGDYLLWKTFINHKQLHIVSAHLAGFKIHKGQLTEDSQRAYKQEVRKLAESRSLVTFFLALVHKLCWLLPDSVKKTLSQQVFEYDSVEMIYRIG